MSESKTFTIELKLNTNQNDEAILAKRFLIAEHMYNKTVKFARKQWKQMHLNKRYRQALHSYFDYKDIGDKATAKIYANKLTEFQKQYQLTENHLHAFIKTQQHMYKKHIDSLTAQKIATTVWSSVYKMMFGDGKHICYKKHDTLQSVEGKTNTSGIRFIDNKLSWNKLIIPVKIRKNDLFIQESLSDHKVKYCRIIRRPFNSGYKYFVQLIMDGTPPVKKNKYGSLRHGLYTNDNVGIDIGPSSIAVCSQKRLLLEKLAPQVEPYDREILRLARKLERSRRATNPLNYNPNGTIKKEANDWIRSKNYMRMLFKLRNVERRRAVYLRLHHNRFSNLVLSLGTNVYVEDMNFKALQKRSKKTTFNSKGKCNRKKRFGKSINSNAPSLLLRILDHKLNYQGKSLNKVNTFTFKASQYNHITDTYVKKKLSQRHSVINNERIQRDLYSAFLIMNSNPDLQTTNRNECFNTYESFRTKHHILINQMKSSHIKYPISFGI